MNQRSAMIIGAGLAGLTCADTLVAADWDVTVLEARDRVGGRAWTGTASNGALIERGAEWVEDEQVQLIALCNRFDIPLVRAGMSYHDRRPIGGPPVSDDELVLGRHRIREALEELGDSAADLSALAVIDRLPVSEGVRVALRARVECTCGTPAADLAATHLQMLAHAPDVSDALRIGTGSDAPARALAEQLGERVRLSSPVTSITLVDDGVTVATATGLHSAARLILALPAAVVREAPFVDVLPDAVAATLGQFGIAQAAKIFIPLTGETTPGAHLDVHRDYWVWAANGIGGALRPVVCGFVGSQVMIDCMDVEHGAATWAGRVSEVRPDVPLDLAAAEAQTWHDDPYARGVYTAIPPGARPDMGLLRRQHGPLLLAGEYTDDVWPGYMEGAVRSGHRAAALLIGAIAVP